MSFSHSRLKYYALVAVIGLLSSAYLIQRYASPTLIENETVAEAVVPATNLAPEITTDRTVYTTDGQLHSIPLSEILAGGPAKDGIPSINEPEFISTTEADSFLDSEDIGLGLELHGETRFYPYQILVWHEIVNDVIGDTPLAVTYCPLCATGVVYERRVDGEAVEFGVSGRLWQSNLLMYNRADTEANESLWSQVLGEAVVGVHTGQKLTIVPAHTVRYGDWKSAHPATTVLSRNTGTPRQYGRDPYGDYYENERVAFGATFEDDRAHPKEYVLGFALDEDYHAVVVENLPVGDTTLEIAARTVLVRKTDSSEVTIFDERNEVLPIVGAFWFSWLAVHPETTLHTVQ